MGCFLHSVRHNCYFSTSRYFLLLPCNQESVWDDVYNHSILDMCASVMDARVGLRWSALQPSLVTTRSHSVTQPSTPPHTNIVPADMRRDCHAPVETRRGVFSLLLSSVSPPLLLISPHVNGSSSVASPVSCPGAGTQAASSRPGLWGISPPPA